MSSYGIKVSKEGFDARTAEDKNLRLTSELPILKIAVSGTFSITVLTGGSTIVTEELLHNLGYYPNFIILTQYNVNGNFRRTNGFSLLSDELDYNITVDNEKISVTAFAVGVSGVDRTFNGYYYVFYDPI